MRSFFALFGPNRSGTRSAARGTLTEGSHGACPSLGTRTPWRTALMFLALAALGLGWVRPATATEAVSFVNLDGDRCFMFSLLAPQSAAHGNYSVVINNEADYRKLFSPRITRQSCADENPRRLVPKVNFRTRTVIGLWVSAPCFATGFTRHVLRDGSRRLIIYSVKTVGPPKACMGPGPASLNLISIPKIPDGYKVLFEPKAPAAR